MCIWDSKSRIVIYHVQKCYHYHVTRNIAFAVRMSSISEYSVYLVVDLKKNPVTF